MVNAAVSDPINHSPINYSLPSSFSTILRP
jgi:hypothetical protein